VIASFSSLNVIFHEPLLKNTPIAETFSHILRSSLFDKDGIVSSQRTDKVVI
jgi:hypothetical protein